MNQQIRPPALEQQGPNVNVIRIPPPPVATLPVFDPQEMRFSTWLQIFDEFCFLIDVEEEPAAAEGMIPPHNRKRALFLTHIGTLALEVLAKRAAPNLPNQFSIPALTETLLQYYERPEVPD